MNNYELGDTIELAQEDVEVVACDDCSHLMVNIDADQITRGDLLILKRAGVRLSNPETQEHICLNCEYNKPTFGQKLRDWFDDQNDDDDTPFFVPTPTVSSPSFGGSSSFGGFGGFGGGVFSGGGASRSF